MGLGLAAMAVLATFLAIWAATAIGHQLRAPAQGAPVTQSDGPLGLGLVEHG